MPEKSFEECSMLCGFICVFFSSRRRHTRCLSDWSSDVCSSDLYIAPLILGCCALALAQESMPRDDKSDARMATFQAKVDLVLVPVVVRDKHRRPIGNFTKDDFRLFDNGKPRTIASFSTVE